MLGAGSTKMIGHARESRQSVQAAGVEFHGQRLRNVEGGDEVR